MFKYVYSNYLLWHIYYLFIVFNHFSALLKTPLSSQNYWLERGPEEFSNEPIPVQNGKKMAEI